MSRLAAFGVSKLSWCWTRRDTCPRRCRLRWQAACCVGLAEAASAIYTHVVRPWYLRWGATESEVRSHLPGDELVGHPMLAATRAITIDAPPHLVWPWIVQMGGYTRAGWYAYDGFDNAGNPSADRIIPELQQLSVGDVLLTSPTEGFTVRALEPGRFLLMAIDDDRSQISSLMYLEPIGGEQTRLVTRLRAYFRPQPLSALFGLVFGPGDFLFMRRMMLGIKERAERLARDREHPTPG